MQTVEFDAPIRAQSKPRSWFDQRIAGLPPWLVVSQLFFGLGWARAAAAKVISLDWWTGATVSEFVAGNDAATLGWFRGAAELAADLAPVTALAVLLTQLFVAASMVTNRAFGLALAAASLLNLSFVAIGAVNPSAFYLFGQGAMALWLIGRLKPTAALSRTLRFAVAVAVAVAAISAPFIETLHPAHVIDDPAIMLAFLGGLAAVAIELTHRALFGRSLP